MAKAASNGYIDGGLTAISGSNILHVCSAEPANFAGIAAVTLGNVALTGGDFTLADGDTNGRKVTVGQQTDFPVTATGTANHVVISDGTDIYVTTATAQPLTNGNTVTSPAWDIEIADPI